MSSYTPYTPYDNCRPIEAHPVPYGKMFAVQATTGELQGYRKKNGEIDVWKWSSYRLAALMCDGFERRLKGRL